MIDSIEVRIFNSILYPYKNTDTFPYPSQPEDVFVEFDPRPLGAASLAQVHRARLQDGREVAVKVQHPLVKTHSKVDMKGMEVMLTGPAPFASFLLSSLLDLGTSRIFFLCIFVFPWLVPF